jgi:hypothetical protein
MYRIAGKSSTALRPSTSCQTNIKVAFVSTFKSVTELYLMVDQGQPQSGCHITRTLGVSGTSTKPQLTPPVLKRTFLEETQS